MTVHTGHGIIDVRSFGAKGDGVTDDLAAIQAACDSIGSTYPNNQGATIMLPPATYRLSGPLHIRRGLKLLGASPCYRNAGKSVLLVDSGQHGIIVDYLDAAGHGAFACIENIAVKAAAKSGTVHGIWAKASVYIRGCFISSFSGHGIFIDSTGGSVADFWEVKFTTTSGHTLHGLFTDGADSNAGVATAVDSNSNGGWGIYDSSFLGNTYIQCHTEGNTLGAYKADAATGFSVFLGCYAETNQPANDIISPSLVLGGDISAVGFTAGSTACRLVGSGLFQGKAAYQKTNGGKTLTHYLGDESATMRMWGWNASDDPNGPWRMVYDQPDTGWYGILHADTATRCAIAFPSDAITQRAYAPWFMNGFYLGGASTAVSNARLWRGGTAAPGSGTWVAGDIIWNRAVGAQTGLMGWVCTVGGTPGTWVPFGSGFRPIVAKSGNYTATDDDDVILCTAGAGGFTITLPAAAGRAGKTYTIKKVDSAAGTITVDGNASETIDGATTYVLDQQNEVVRIISDGTNWQVI